MELWINWLFGPAQTVWQFLPFLVTFHALTRYVNAKVQTRFQNNSDEKVAWDIDVSKMMEGCPAHMSNLPRSAAKSYNLRSK